METRPDEPSDAQAGRPEIRFEKTSLQEVVAQDKLAVVDTPDLQFGRAFADETMQVADMPVRAAGQHRVLTGAMGPVDVAGNDKVTAGRGIRQSGRRDRSQTGCQ